MNAKKDIIKSIIVLTVICLVISGALAVVNHFTAPVSEANKIQRETNARMEIIPDADSFEEYTGELPDGVSAAYIGKDSAGNAIGYIITAKSTGFGGLITVMCGIDSEGKIISVKTMDVSTETSTLGGKTANSDYTDQYTGADASLSGVSAISGATITSTAYETCVKTAFEAYDLMKGGN